MEHDDVLFSIQLPTDPITVRLRGLVVIGRLDRIVHLLAIAEEHPGHVFDIDLAEVSFVDSHGVAFLVALKTAIFDGGGRARFLSASPRVRRILERTGVGALLYKGPQRPIDHRRPRAVGTPFAA